MPTRVKLLIVVGIAQDFDCLKANRPSCPARPYQGFEKYTCQPGYYCKRTDFYNFFCKCATLEYWAPCTNMEFHR